MSESKTDILIIGGGIAGCIAAISLVKDFKVILIDKLAQPKEKIGESLAPASRRILTELNLLQDFEDQFGELFLNNNGMQSYWGSDQVHIVDHMRNPDGFVKSLDRKAFEAFLRKAAERRGVRCFWGQKLHRAAAEDADWKVTLTNSEDISDQRVMDAKYVIDASGRQAYFARSIGIKRQIEDKLVACWVSLPNTFENTMSTISASENGWWYSAVVPNQKRVIAFQTDADLVEKHQLKTKKALLALAKRNKEIATLIAEEDSNIQFHGTVSANTSRLEEFAGANWAAVGDAAVSFDPLSSQGMFNAMASAMQLSTLIKQSKFGAAIAENYSNQIDQVWQYYLNHRTLFYQGERRWPDAAFWKRRS